MPLPVFISASCHGKVIGVAMTCALGTQAGIDSLRSDVLTIHNASKDVLTKAGELKVPSWRFPEKLSTSIDVDTLLKDLCYSNSHDKDCASHVLLLELIVDRFLLLLQGCLLLSDRSRTSAPPLTLQSSVKKFARKFIQDATALKSQVSTDTTSGHSNRLLPEVLHYDSSSTQQVTPFQTRAQQSAVACQTVDTAFATCARCFDFQRCAVDVSSSVAQLCQATSGRDSILAATDWKSLAAIGALTPAKWEVALGKDLASVRDHCTLTEKALRKLTSDLNERDELVRRVEGDSRALGAQVDSLGARVQEVRLEGEVALAKSEEGWAVRLGRLEEAKAELEGRATLLTSELDGAKMEIEQLRAHATQLEQKVKCLESELQRELERGAQVNLLHRDVEEELARVKVEAADWQRRGEEQSVEARKAIAHTLSLEKRNKSIQAKQSTLLARLDELDRECEHLRCEVARHSSAAEGKRVELEVMEAKCSDLQSKCTELQATVADHETKNVHSTVEQQRLASVVFTLEEQVRELRVQLETEKERCHLLMEYPYIKPIASKDTIATMTPLDSQRQVSANTIRILLLEEQNSELRQQQTASVAREADPSSHQSTATPTKLWKTNLLSRAAREKVNHPEGVKGQRETHSARARTDHVTSAMAAKEQRSSRSQSTTRLKGRLGHLVTAIAEAHGEPAVPPARALGWVGGGRGHVQHPKDVEVYTCQMCDRMFGSLSELGQHQRCCNSESV